jgi:hypothetical protein
LDKDQHKHEQNEQFDRAFKEIQKYHQKEFNREFKGCLIDIITLVILGIYGIIFMIEELMK